jgi:hypothetical protein
VLQFIVSKPVNLLKDQRLWLIFETWKEMWRTISSSSSSSRISRTLWKAGPLAAAASWLLLRDSAPCVEAETNETNKETPAAPGPSRRLRKQNTLRQAVSNVSHGLPRRINTREELSKLRQSEKEMLRRWERDEDGWRALPARAWPAYQPDPEQLKGIQADVTKHGCTSESKTDFCKDLIFNMSTALVFYSVDPEAGYRHYKGLAQQGHVESMVACGVVLMEGMGVPAQEKKAVEWLEKAVAQNSAQGCYELGTVLYTGVDGVFEEDPEAAFALFQKAAEQDHTAGMYMMADCLVEGEGTEVDVGRAVPLFYQAAERGHRYSRQRIRELLAKQEYRER